MEAESYRQASRSCSPSVLEGKNIVWIMAFRSWFPGWVFEAGSGVRGTGGTPGLSGVTSCRGSAQTLAAGRGAWQGAWASSEAPWPFLALLRNGADVGWPRRLRQEAGVLMKAFF